MEGDDESTAAFEAALGLNPRFFIDSALDIVDDIGHEAFQFARQEATASGVLGTAEKAAELERGFNAIHHLLVDLLDKRMASWEKYCFRRIFTLPEGFVLPKDDNSCANESQSDGTSDPNLDLELNLLRKKLESANEESENLRRDISSLERQKTYKKERDSLITEIKKSFEEKSVKQNFEDLAKAIPILQQKIITLNKKRTEAGSLVDLLRDNKRLALHKKDFTARAEDTKEVVNILRQNE